VVLFEGTYAISGEFGLVHGAGEFSIRGGGSTAMEIP
jgi:hypothetical protein